MKYEYEIVGLYHLKNFNSGQLFFVTMRSNQFRVTILDGIYLVKRNKTSWLSVVCIDDILIYLKVI